MFQKEYMCVYCVKRTRVRLTHTHRKRERKGEIWGAAASPFAGPVSICGAPKRSTRALAQTKHSSPLSCLQDSKAECVIRRRSWTKNLDRKLFVNVKAKKKKKRDNIPFSTKGFSLCLCLSLFLIYFCTFFFEKTGKPFFFV